MKHPIKKSTYPLIIIIVLTLAALVAQVGSLAAEQTNIFLPFTLQTNRLTIAGQITGPNGLPLADVQIFISGSPANATANMPQAVHASAVTDANGNYSLPGLLAGDYTVTPVKTGYSFAPASHQLSLPSQDAAQNFLGSVSDGDLIVNGTCEDDDGWTFPKTPHSARYSQEQEHGGNRSIRTGIATTSENVLSHSTANQIFSVPNTAQQYTLSLWVYTSSGEANNANIPEQPDGLFDPDATLDNDLQYILVLNPETDEVVEVLYWERKNDKEWQRIQFDMRNYAGMTIKLHIGTYNNGYGGVTAMYVDDISFDTGPLGPTPTPGTVITPSPTPTPTLTPTPLPTTTPLPANCHNEVENFSFEEETIWEILNTAYTAEYSQEEVYYGTQAMQIGIVAARDNRLSYSDVRQTISIPYAAHIDLYFWQYPISGEPASNIFEPVSLTSNWGEQAMTGDMQYVLAIDESGNQLLLYQNRTDEAEWVLRHLDLKNFAGQTIKLQFGVYNDGGGGVTGMYVDNVVLLVCP